MSVVPGVLNGSRGYFTLFSSKHKYFIKQTAICFYSIEAINRHFSTSNSFYDNETFETKKWPPTTLNSNTAHPKGIDPTNTDFYFSEILGHFQYNKLGCVVRMVVESKLPDVVCGPNDHRRDAHRLLLG